jgi:hypothetical protein
VQCKACIYGKVKFSRFLTKEHRQCPNCHKMLPHPLRSAPFTRGPTSYSNQGAMPPSQNVQ